MSDKFSNSPYMPGPSNGVLQGPDMAMPDRGTSSGTVGMGAPYGASIDAGATNRIGGIGRSTQSDPIDACYPMGGGDFSSSGGEHGSTGGRGMGGAAKSDSAYDNVPDDPLHPDADDR